jgi:microcystin-dependent protein
VPELGDIGDETDLLTNGSIPVGTMLPYAGQSAPTGWTLCNGVEVTRSSDLGTWLNGRFGNGNGSTTYNTPDMRDKYPLGKAESGTGSTFAGTGGAFSHVHGDGSYAMPSHDHQNSSLVLPAHSHTDTFDVSSHSHTIDTNSFASTNATDADANATVGGTGATDPGVTGSISNSAAAGISSGRLGSATPAVEGITGTDVGMPYQTVNYIIKN